MKYPKDIDPHCVHLCDAINSIPGLETYESCSGHGKDPMRIWFTVSKLHNMYVLLRSIDYRYVGLDGWLCNAQDTDLTNRPVVFCLNSGSCTGKRDYAQSRKITNSIINFLDNKKFMRMWKIK
jgi:hypothetical protein